MEYGYDKKFSLKKISRTDSLILIFIVMIIILIVVLLPANSSSKTGKYIKYAKMYVESNNISGTKFISLYDLETANIYNFDGCNKATGIFYNNGKYEEYVMCNDYYSDNIKEMETSNKYISLNSDPFLITSDSKFKDPGYILKNKNYKVNVYSNFTPNYGLYTFIYTVIDNNSQRVDSLTRKVLYTNYNAQYNNNSIILYGSNPYYVLKNKTFVDPGYSAYDINGINQTKNVQVIGNVNVNKPGEYEIIYKLNQVENKRLVIVSDIEASFTNESLEYTNKGYKLSLIVKGSDYLKTILPNGKETKSTVIDYEVSNNNIYSFIIYDKYNNQLKLDKKVNNIDLKPPSGSCKNKLELGKTIVTVDATDSESGILNYVYNNNDSKITNTQPNYTYNGLYKEITVTINDKVGNSSTIKCTSSGEGANAQIKPPSGANIIKSDDSDTLKVSIEKKGSYYITRVWVLDPYNQINKGIILENWNKKRASAATILQNEITNKNLNNKIVVGINGSGFYENGTWTPNCTSSSYKNQYNRTTEGPLVIHEGKVIRNWYDDGAVDRSRNHSIYTVSKEGNFEVYQNFNKLSENDRKTLFDSIINKGYRNTWTFRPVAILNGTILTTNLVGEQMKNRNVVCQIDRNNWVVLTGETTAKDAVNILKNLGCQTAVNMDGSGSVSLHFKSKTGSLEKIHGGGREVVDTLYFTEK